MGDYNYCSTHLLFDALKKNAEQPASVFFLDGFNAVLGVLSDQALFQYGRLDADMTHNHHDRPSVVLHSDQAALDALVAQPQKAFSGIEKVPG